jgi:Dynamin central region/Dynamin family
LRLTSIGLCTRYATEYVLRRTEHVSSIAININPDPERPEYERNSLIAWQPSTTSPDEFGKIMSEAAAAMGIGQNGKTFSHDRLRIEVCGPDQPHLTLVDVPGLFHSRGKSQSDTDKAAVYSLVESYIKNPRSIIMAVISAKNDKENQIVITFAETYDPNGDRTIGVITKPDTLPVNSPSEEQYYTLAQNKDAATHFALGWAVVRNRSFEEQGSSQFERDEMEKQFFDRGIWKNLDSETKGVMALRRRLGKILHNHILTEMPSMLEDVDAGISECEQKLAALGSSRGTLDDQRMYLLQASTKFGSLMAASNDGVYTDSFFGSGVDDKDFHKRVCAISSSILDQFKDEITRHGHAIELISTLPKNYKHVAGKPRKMLEGDYYKHVEFVMERNRGRELPGLFNPAIVKPLFLDQSRPWRSLVMQTLGELLDVSRTAVRLVLDTTADETTVEGILSEIVNPAIESIECTLKAKAEQDLVPFEKWPSTYNHYFTENLQKRRQDQLTANLDTSLHSFLGVNPAEEDIRQRMYMGEFDVRGLRNALKQETEKNMKRFAAIEASNAMFAYYKVGISTFDMIFKLTQHRLRSRKSPTLSPWTP